MQITAVFQSIKLALAIGREEGSVRLSLKGNEFLIMKIYAGTYINQILKTWIFISKDI